MSEDSEPKIIFDAGMQLGFLKLHTQAAHKLILLASNDHKEQMDGIGAATLALIQLLTAIMRRSGYKEEIPRIDALHALGLLAVQQQTNRSNQQIVESGCQLARDMIEAAERVAVEDALAEVREAQEQELEIRRKLNELLEMTEYSNTFEPPKTKKKSEDDEE